MILIGQYDSPFVRRVGIALRHSGLPFEHRPWSVWRDAAKIAQFNPLRRVPTLLLRGAQSDLLTHETAQAMTQRGPKARLVEFEGVGHAPTLVAPDQVAAVREFLLPP